MDIELSLRNLLEQARLLDLLDIAIVSVLIHVAFSWLRDRASRSMVVVLVALFSLFLLARGFDLYLTTLAFNFGSVVILLVLVVIFQQDIRQGFERLATTSLWRKSDPTVGSRDWINTLAEAIGDMADQRMGALIVLPGQEPLDRHLRGGVDVDAKVSRPLLMSIFHPKSPGHDGAIVIHRGRIASLGIHLPLTRHVQLLGGRGTRHAAALGLAEASDATVIAVSEEVGTISFANNATMQTVERTAVVDALLNYAPAANAPTNRARPAIHWRRLFGSVVAATALWFTFAYTTDVVQRTLVVPIEYRNVPSGFEVSEPKSKFAEVTLTGSESAFKLLDPASVMVSLESENTSSASRVVFETREHLKGVPQELNVDGVNPQSVYVSLESKSD